MITYEWNNSLNEYIYGVRGRMVMHQIVALDYAGSIPVGYLETINLSS